MSESKIKQSTSRIVELDALRAIAAINLMLFHFTFVYQVKYGFSSPLGFQLPYGKYGVQLFFMLSGFVNAMTLLRKREAADFLASRMIRIVPSFYLLVAINLFLLCLSPLNQGGGYSAAQVAANLSLMPNLFGFSCLEPVTWTLQIEILFYLILVGMFVSGSLQNPFRTLMLYLLLCYVGGQALLNLPSVENRNFYGHVLATLGDVLLLKYMPLFCIGVLLYQLKSDYRNAVTYYCGIAMSTIVFHAIDDHGHNPVVTLFLIGLLGLAAFGKVPVLRSKFFVFLSGISYSLYLLHNHLGCVLMYRLDNAGVPPLVCLGIALIFSVAIAAAWSHYLERPLSNWLTKQWKTWKPLIQRQPVKNLDSELSLRAER